MFFRFKNLTIKSAVYSFTVFAKVVSNRRQRSEFFSLTIKKSSW